MFRWVEKFVTKIWVPISRYTRMNHDNDADDDINDELVWFRDLERHAFGEFSFAVVQANENLEDYSQVETGREGTFMGVYDGHGGIEASRYVCENLFTNLIRYAQEQGLISEGTLNNAFSATEEGFLNVVRGRKEVERRICSVGSCCLVGLIWKKKLYVCNMGDSRAVLGRLRSTGRKSKIVAEQITQDHNCSRQEIRDELKIEHPHDERIVLHMNGSWRVRGIIQISRSIGDGYLKSAEFSMGPDHPKAHLLEPINEPLLKDYPEIHIRDLQPTDKFLVFASDGLWEHITNKQAVEIVHKYPRAGIAKRLLKKAMTTAATKAHVSYADITNKRRGFRRSYHDDITVIVIFIDDALLQSNASVGVNEVSVKGYNNHPAPSRFRELAH